MSANNTAIPAMRENGPAAAISRRAALGRLGAAGLAAAVAAQRGRDIAAQDEATPAAGPDSRSPAANGGPSADQQPIAQSVRYQHPEKVFYYMPGFGDEAVIASLYGLDVEAYRSIKGRFAATARSAAQELLADPAFAERVDRLPFRPGETVLAIGESDTDDLQSWLEIVRHLLDLRRGEDEIRVVNAAISGQTTTAALGRVAGTILMERPNWVICGLGGNDVARHGTSSERTLVTLDETASNLTAMRQAAAKTDPEIQWVWMTRWPIDEARVAAYPGFQMGDVSWTNADSAAVREIVRGQADPVVDLYPAFGQPPAPNLLESDGLHPSLAGQQIVARAFVETLTA